MPFSSVVLDDLQLNVVRLFGDLDADGVDELQQTLLGEPEVDGLDTLFDLTDVGAIDLTAGPVGALGSRSRELRAAQRPGRLAILAPGDVAFGLARMYEMLAAATDPDRQIGVFRTLTSVADWLDLPEGWRPPPPDQDDML